MLPTDFTPLFAKPSADPAAILFVFLGEDLLATTAGELPDLSGCAQALASRIVIGTWAGQSCEAALWPAGMDLPDGLVAQGLRSLWGVLPDALYGIAARAKQMLWWHGHTRFCGVCGTATEVMTDEPARCCPACGERAYPRLSPAMMVLIHRGEEILLARAPHFRPGVYSALAGFVEAGETVEECIHREVAEEVGLKVSNLRWFASQSWPFPHSLMLAFHADYVSGEIVPQVDEIEDARWFHKDALPDLPSSASIAARLIEDGLLRHD